MSLCWIMQSDFLYGTGRHDEATGAEGYSDDDLQYGVQYASDYIDLAGITKEPLYGYDLVKFRDWCIKQLGEAP